MFIKELIVCLVKATQSKRIIEELSNPELSERLSGGGSSFAKT